MINNILNRLLNSIIILPNREAWYLGFILLIFYGLISLFWQFSSDFLQLQLLKSPLKITEIIIYSFFAPALLEETFFRFFLLPQPTQNLTQLPLLVVIINLIIFVIYHPLNAVTFFPRGYKTFTNQTFLSLAGLLGLVCIVTYWQSGSLWLPVIVHWIVVITWLIGFGGYNRLYQTEGVDDFSTKEGLEG